MLDEEEDFEWEFTPGISCFQWSEKEKKSHLALKTYQKTLLIKKRFIISGKNVI